MAYIPFTSRVDGAFTLSNLNDTVQTMQARQDAAKLQYNKIAQQISKFNFAPEEDAYRAKLMNDITTIRDNFSSANGGYIGYNLNDLIDAETKILTNPGVIGREKYNIKRQDYLKEIDNSNMSETYKEYYRLHAGYNYKDTVDEKGNVIGGNEFEPADRPTKVINFADIIDRGVRLAAKESGGGSSTRPQISPDGSYMYFNTSSGSWEKLSPEKIKQGIMAELKNTDGALDSLRQDLKIDQWRAIAKGQFDNNYAFDESGFPLSMDAYIDARMKEAIAAANYYNHTSSSSISNIRELSNGVTQRSNSSSAYGGMGGGYDPSIFMTDNNKGISITTTTPLLTDDTSAVDADAIVKDCKKSLNDLFNDPKKTSTGRSIIPVWSNNPQQNIILINKYLKNPGDRTKALRLLDQYNENKEYLSTLMSGLSESDRTKVSDYQSLLNGGEIKDPKLKQQYSSITKALFPNGSDSVVRQYFSSNDAYMQTLNNLGGTEGAMRLGLNIGEGSDGRKYIEISGRNVASLPALVTAVDSGISSQGIFARGWQGFKRSLSHNFGNSLVRVVNGKEEKIPVEGEIHGFDTAFDDLRKLYDKAKMNHDSILNAKKILVGRHAINAMSPEMADLIVAKNTGRISKELFNEASSDIENELKLHFAHLDVNQTGCQVVVGDHFEEVSTADALAIKDALNATDIKDLNPTLIPDYKTERWGVLVNVPIKNKEGKIDEIKKVFIKDGIKDRNVESWNLHPDSKALIKVTKSVATNKPILVGRAGQYTTDNIYLKPNTDGFDIVVGGKTLSHIDNDQAQMLTSLYNIYDASVNYAVNTGQPIEYATQATGNYGNALAALLGRDEAGTKGILLRLLNYNNNLTK